MPLMTPGRTERVPLFFSSFCSPRWAAHAHRILGLSAMTDSPTKQGPNRWVDGALGVTYLEHPRTHGPKHEDNNSPLIGKKD